MPNERLGKQLGVIVGLGLLAVLVAFIAAPTLTALHENSTVTRTHSEGEVIFPGGQDKFSAEIDNVGSVSGDMTLTLTDVQSNQSETNTFQQSTVTYSLVGGNVTVTNHETIGGDSANNTFEYSKEYGFTENEAILFNHLDILMMILLVMILGSMILVGVQS